jgi:hypothetical protein
MKSCIGVPLPSSWGVWHPVLPRVRCVRGRPIPPRLERASRPSKQRYEKVGGKARDEEGRVESIPQVDFTWFRLCFIFQALVLR